MQIVHVEVVNARVAELKEIPEEFSESAKSVLKSLGITKLYSHQVWMLPYHFLIEVDKPWRCCVFVYLSQAESINASLCGRNVVVATTTSSGKSLCYNLPVLEALCQNLLSCALYLFPTKVKYIYLHDSVSCIYFCWEIYIFLIFIHFVIYWTFPFSYHFVLCWRKSSLYFLQALAQDQLRALQIMTERFEDLNIGVYDGDTSQAQRNWLRANARLVF